MQLFLDSSDLRESEKALKTGILNGVITNPEMMKRYGEQDTDALILKLAKRIYYYIVVNFNMIHYLLLIIFSRLIKLFIVVINKLINTQVF